MIEMRWLEKIRFNIPRIEADGYCSGFYDEVTSVLQYREYQEKFSMGRLIPAGKPEWKDVPTVTERAEK